MLSKNCQQCNKVFVKPYGRSVRDWNSRAKFCSKDCRDTSKKGKPSSSPTTTFKKGHNLFAEDTRKKRRGSENNMWKGGKVSLICRICSIEFNVDLYRKDIAKTCSLICYNKYRKLPEVRIKASKKQKESSKNRLKTITKSLDKLIRHSVHYKLWRETIFKRDNWTCQICKKKGGKLIADHIKQFALIILQNDIKTFEESILCVELWNLNNGRTLCHNCHILTETYGQKIKK